MTPFNFTSIAGNLPTAAALMGNVVLWKPASTAVLSAYYIMKLLEEAGLPAGRDQLRPRPRRRRSAIRCSTSPALAGIHFTGSTARLPGHVEDDRRATSRSYKSYPRIVGETGGKDFIFAHPRPTSPRSSTALVRGAFEYQGQKCSAASRAYVPRSLWPTVKEGLRTTARGDEDGAPHRLPQLHVRGHRRGRVRDDQGYIDYAKQSKDAEIIAGGKCDDSEGYFIEPTVIADDRPATSSSWARRSSGRC